MTLRSITPIYGGSPVPRRVDRLDVIRPASIRGQLRFWWRALHAHEHGDPKDLYAAERELWGGSAGQSDGGRSPVELRVDLKGPREDLEHLVQPGQPKEPDRGYALFPARAEQPKRGEKADDGAERYEPGITFDLTLRCPASRRADVRQALLAWLLFGGYGGRTRRGLGSLIVVDKPSEWLPADPSRKTLARLFGRDILAAAERPATFTPALAGAEFRAGSRCGHEVAWTTAVSWLRRFRQGQDGPHPAREAGDSRRPGRSRWPEADKIRRLSELPRGMKWAHDPRHNEVPAWPRAVLGLPIIGQFQRKTRDGKFWPELDPPKIEPDDFELGWLKDGIPHDRLASPLIVKALPLADGTSVPFALWLSRANPPGPVVLCPKSQTGSQRRGRDARAPLRGAPHGTEADFDVLATDEAPRFELLAQHRTLRAVFFAWLESHLAGSSKHPALGRSPAAARTSRNHRR